MYDRSCVDGSSSFIVVGCGQVGYRVACLLLALGEDVHVVSSAVRKDWRRRLEEAGAGFTVGDGTDQVVLRSVGVQNAQAVLACTSSDTTNVRVTLEAKRIAPGVKVVARLFDQHLAERLENGIGIERALAMSVVAAPSFASAATGTDVVGEFHIGEMRFMLVRTLVHGESDLVGMSPTEVGAKFRAETVLRIDKDGKPMSDIRHNEPLEVGEVVKLIGVPNDLASLVPDMAHRTKSPRKSRMAILAGWANAFEIEANSF